MYFIEMVKNPETKLSLFERLSMTPEEKAEAAMPVSKSLIDALYVVLACRFQDRPLKSAFMMLSFIVLFGLLAAKIIMSIF